VFLAVTECVLVVRCVRYEVLNDWATS